MTEDPESLVLQLLRALRDDIASVKGDIARLDTKIDRAEGGLLAHFRSEMNSLRADVASDMLTFQKHTGEQIVGLRRAVVEYYSAVVGHGVLIGDLEARVRRVERHLNLPAFEPG